jgi:hypothetical protein
MYANRNAETNVIFWCEWCNLLIRSNINLKIKVWGVKTPAGNSILYPTQLPNSATIPFIQLPFSYHLVNSATIQFTDNSASNSATIQFIQLPKVFSGGHNPPPGAFPHRPIVQNNNLPYCQSARRILIWEPVRQGAWRRLSSSDVKVRPSEPPYPEGSQRNAGRHKSFSRHNRLRGHSA